MCLGLGEKEREKKRREDWGRDRVKTRKGEKGG